MLVSVYTLVCEHQMMTVLVMVMMVSMLGKNQSSKKSKLSSSAMALNRSALLIRFMVSSSNYISRSSRAR